MTDAFVVFVVVIAWSLCMSTPQSAWTWHPTPSVPLDLTPQNRGFVTLQPRPPRPALASKIFSRGHCGHSKWGDKVWMIVQAGNAVFSLPTPAEVTCVRATNRDLSFFKPIRDNRPASVIAVS